MSFILERKLDLSGVSPDWKGAYITLKDLSVDTIQRKMSQIAKVEDGSKEQIDTVRELLEEAFVDGKAWNGKELVKIKKEDVKDLPMTVWQMTFSFLAQTSSEQTSKPSTQA